MGVMQVSKQAPRQLPTLPGLNLPLQLHQHPLCQVSSTRAAGEKGSFTQLLPPGAMGAALGRAVGQALLPLPALCSPPQPHLAMTICTMLRRLRDLRRHSQCRAGAGQAAAVRALPCFPPLWLPSSALSPQAAP